VLDASGFGFVPSSRRTTKTSMQLPSLTGLKTRFRERVDDSARGSDVPAGIERGADAVAAGGARERGRVRRRLRELRRLREAQLLELGALVLEAHKHDRDASRVIKSKAAEAAATDAEARVLTEALGTDAGLDTVVAAGIAGPCPTCGTLAATTARFCSTCGTPLDGRPDATPRVDTEDAPDTPLLDARDVDAAELEPATTELPAANGNGAVPDDIEATTGHEA
jgi:RNase P protein component